MVVSIKTGIDSHVYIQLMIIIEMTMLTFPPTLHEICVKKKSLSHV